MSATTPKRLRPRKAEKRAASEAARQAEIDAMYAIGLERSKPIVAWFRAGMVGQPDTVPFDMGQARAEAAAIGEVAYADEVQRLVLERQLGEIRARQAAQARRALTPMMGEAVDPQKLETQAIVSPAVHDRERPRAAVLTGDLPRAVRDMVTRGWLSAEGAAALARFADDHEQAWRGGVGTQDWSERVDGGRVGGERGRSAAAVAAGLRFAKAERALGENNSRLVRKVMLEGVALWEMFDKSSRKDTRALVVTGMLIKAAEQLVEHYRALSG